jgi:hypothetical protein
MPIRVNRAGPILMHRGSSLVGATVFTAEMQSNFLDMPLFSCDQDLIFDALRFPTDLSPHFVSPAPFKCSAHFINALMDPAMLPTALLLPIH